MEKIVNSPSANVSKDYILIEQDCVTKIKAAIARNATSKELEQIINAGVSRMAKKDKTLARAMLASLRRSTNYWRFTYVTNMRTLNKTLQAQIVRYQQKELTRVVTEDGKTNTYNINLQSLTNELKANPVKPIDQFRGFDTNARNGIPVIKDYQKLVKSQLRLLASEVPKAYEIVSDKKGNEEIKLMPLRNKIEMAVRYQANQEDVANLKADGVKLVWTSSHASCSPRCAEWQGRLYSLDGSRGKIDGIEYIPLEEALNANNGNSIINGYNCRHYLIEYTPGSKAPHHYTEEEMNKEYALDQKQRAYENQIRNLKANASVFGAKGDNILAAEYDKKAKILELRYEAFSLKNNRAYYSWRTQILEVE